jgi:glucose/arabinose dehydrogenase
VTAIDDPRAPIGFALEPVATGLDFPTSLSFAPDGRCYVAESGLPFAGARPGGRVWEVIADGGRRPLTDGLPSPVNGLSWHDEGLVVSATGEIDRLELNGTRAVILDRLPSGGNYHTNMAIAGADDWLYFSQGAMTNAGIVGLDAYELSWLRRLPHTHDIPGFDIVLRGVEIETDDPLADAPDATARTGAFVPFGSLGGKGCHIPAGLPCTAAVMRVRPDGSELELVAWGLRNAFGLGFLPDGRLLAIDQGADDRGSRPIGDAPDLLFEVVPGAWYGWPDFIGGEPVTALRFLPERGLPPSFIIANHNELPPPQLPLFRFQSHVAATKFAVVPDGTGSPGNRIAIALFGDEKPMTGPPGQEVGRSIAILNFAEDRLQPLSMPGLARPIDVAYHPLTGELYVLDFGHFEMLPAGRLDATAGSGTLWRATPVEGGVQ